MHAEDLPKELGSLLKDLNLDIQEGRTDADYSDRKFVNIEVEPFQNIDKITLKLVLFNDSSDWDYILIEYKNCVYQDAPTDVMTRALKNLLLGNIKHKKTLFGGKDKLVITDGSDNIILKPNTIH